ncbi:hypothetical protein CLV49_0705 [Labedella gwakjiensis]|uniref:Uncharacterized protein n=1 Tax=Labedella gwakjiensis TaxID=390269 RepID=A0A2P8GT03_9MICO|nr:hypothetical protein [Labedella gwakjiensis]PSL37099.1 hypothetical protein CLV49_0705 [Labedella gwakjiensis]RUQ81998.1 hypothetical protein ELQ93_17070 [Labedella gwakjiensis]
MTTATVPLTPTAPSRSDRIWRIVRLHLAAPSVFIGIPWLIVGIAFAVSVAIAALITLSGEDTDGMRYSWAVLSPQWYLVVVGVQAVGMTFPFALGFGVTRRDFWIGTSVLFAVLSLVNAAAFTILVQLEKLTDHWWTGTYMFDSLWYGIGPWYQDFFSTFALQMFVFFVGAAATTLYMRWRVVGVLAAAVALAAVLLGVGLVIGLAGGWDDVWAWVATFTVTGVFSGVLVAALLCAVGGYLVIRRATPRS